MHNANTTFKIKLLRLEEILNCDMQKLANKLGRSI